MAFTASEQPQLIVAIEDIFGGDSMTGSELTHPVEAAKAVLENQTIQTEPLTRNGQCVGVTAYSLVNGVDAADSGYYDTTANTALGCDVIQGDYAQTEGKDYANNVFLSTPWKIQENRCGNLVQRADEFARQIAFSMNINEMKLNERVINTLAANSQPNQWTATPAALTPVPTTNRLGLDSASFNFQGLRLLELAAKSNQIDQPIVIDGNNFYLDHDIARFRALNDNERAGQAAYAVSNLYFDYLDIPRILGRQSTFVVDAGVPIFFNYTTTESMVPVMVDTNHFKMRVPSRNLQWRHDGTLMPVYHEIEYKRECLGRDASGDLIFGWAGMTSLRGLFDLAEAGYTKALQTGVAPAKVLTGIMEFEATTA